jgi:hypothetical protein
LLLGSRQMGETATMARVTLESHSRLSGGSDSSA